MRRNPLERLKREIEGSVSAYGSPAAASIAPGSPAPAPGEVSLDGAFTWYTLPDWTPLPEDGFTPRAFGRSFYWGSAPLLLGPLWWFDAASGVYNASSEPAGDGDDVYEWRCSTPGGTEKFWFDASFANGNATPPVYRTGEWPLWRPYLDFDGTHDCLVMPASGVFQDIHEKTLAVVTDAQSGLICGGANDEVAYGYGIRYAGGTVRAWHQQNGAGPDMDSGQALSGVSLLVARFTDGDSKFYVNGRLTASSTENLATWSYKASIGNTDWDNLPMKGKIYEMVYAHRALNGEELRDLHEHFALKYKAAGWCARWRRCRG